jgi:hypothetical protein
VERHFGSVGLIKRTSGMRRFDASRVLAPLCCTNA